MVNAGRVQGNRFPHTIDPPTDIPLRTPFDRFEGANGEPMHATWLKFDSVRSALALVAFGVTGYFAWLHGNVVPGPVDGSAPVVAIVDAGARPTR